MAHPVANTFRRAAELIAGDARRRGNVLAFAAGEEVVCAGDLHGHRAHLAKLVSFTDPSAHPHRRLILQELLHGGPTDAEGGDRSVEVLLRAARLKVARPEGVFFLLGNHDVAQLTGNEITKNGVGMCRAFDQGLDHAFGPDAAEVRAAVGDLLRGFPLAARCENGVFISHSLPAPGRMPLVDLGILDRAYRDEDLRRGGSAYEWTWGRGHTPEQLDELAGKLDARFFLIGHEPVRGGFDVRHERVAIVASDDRHGTVVAFDAGAEVDAGRVRDCVRPIVAL